MKIHRVRVLIIYPDETEDIEEFYVHSNDILEIEMELGDKLPIWASNNGLVYDDLEWELIDK